MGYASAEIIVNEDPVLMNDSKYKYLIKTTNDLSIPRQIEHRFR